MAGAKSVSQQADTQKGRGKQSTKLKPWHQEMARYDIMMYQVADNTPTDGVG